MSIQTTNNEKDLILTLNLDNGDRDKFTQCLSEWNFKDEQSMLRFLMSIMLESKNKQYIGITTDNNEPMTPYSPADQLLKE